MASREATGLPAAEPLSNAGRVHDITRVRDDAIHRAFRGLLQAAVISSYWNVCHKLGIDDGSLMPTIFAQGLFKAALKTNRDPTEAINSNLAHSDFLRVFCRPDTGTSVVP